MKIYSKRRDKEEQGGTWRSNKEQYVAERSEDDYIS